MVYLKQNLQEATRSLRSWAAPRRRRLIGWAVLIAAFVVATITIGLPLSEDTVLLWLAGALFVASLDDLKNWRSGVLRDWLPLYAVLALYSLLRGYASNVLWGPFVRPQIAFDSFIGLGTEPTAQLQQWLFNPNDLHWWDYATWAVYNSHFFTSFVIAAVLWKRNHERFRRFIFLFVSLTFVGYLGYVFYPAMPPWMAAQAGVLTVVPPLLATAAPVYTAAPSVPAYVLGSAGYTGATTRIIPVVWQHVGLKAAAALFTKGNTFDNNIAAMPSLHAAYPMLIMLFFWRWANRPVRVLLAGYVLAMAFSLVYTGEHFVADEVVGWACAIAVYFGGSRVLDWRRDRKQRAAARSAETDEQPADAVLVDGGEAAVPG